MSQSRNPPRLIQEANNQLEEAERLRNAIREVGRRVDSLRYDLYLPLGEKSVVLKSSLEKMPENCQTKKKAVHLSLVLLLGTVATFTLRSVLPSDRLDSGFKKAILDFGNATPEARGECVGILFLGVALDMCIFAYGYYHHLMEQSVLEKTRSLAVINSEVKNSDDFKQIEHNFANHSAHA